MARLALEEVSFRFRDQNEYLLNKINLSLNAGEVLALVGRSGSGKTTIGLILKGFLEPSKGECRLIDSRSRQRLDARERMATVGFCFARPENQLFASTVAEDVGFGLRNQGFSGAALESRVNDALDLVKLRPSDYLARPPLSLSGGERRRAALAGIAAMDYSFYIYDDPTAGLDENGIDAFRELVNFQRRDGKGVMLITHDISLAILAADRIVKVANGCIVSDDRSDHFVWN